jgi:hypothetical protein
MGDLDLVKLSDALPEINGIVITGDEDNCSCCFGNVCVIENANVS